MLSVVVWVGEGINNSGGLLSAAREQPRLVHKQDNKYYAHKTSACTSILTSLSIPNPSQVKRSASRRCFVLLGDSIGVMV